MMMAEIMLYRVRIALANLFLDLAEAVAPEESGASGIG